MNDIIKQILSSKIKLQSSFESEVKENKPSIYFLIQNDSIVYVGQSTKIEQRILGHQYDKKFDSYFEYRPTDNIELNEIEAYYIFNLLPIYNRSIPYNNRFIALHLLWLEPINNFILSTHHIGKSYYIDLNTFSTEYSIVGRIKSDDNYSRNFCVYKNVEWFNKLEKMNKYEIKSLKFINPCSITINQNVH